MTASDLPPSLDLLLDALDRDRRSLLVGLLIDLDLAWAERATSLQREVRDLMDEPDYDRLALHELFGRTDELGEARDAVHAVVTKIQERADAPVTEDETREMDRLAGLDEEDRP